LTRDQINLLYNLPFFCLNIMRRDELTKMSIDDIKGEHSVLIVAVPDTKTGIKRTVTVTNPEFVRLYRKYVALVPCTHPELKKYYKLCSVAFET
jgi:hypothetical protein